MAQEKTTEHLLADLIEAVMRNDVNAARQSLESGADVNGCEDDVNLTPLHVAATNRAVECVELLLLAGANPIAETDEGETPLDCAKVGSKLHEVDEKRNRIISLLEAAILSKK